MRPAPAESPQGGNAARVGGCSGRHVFSFFVLTILKNTTMKFFIDTANLDQIKEAKDLGVLDGVTTNPSLMAKEGISGKSNIRKHYEKICELVEGDVSAEVISTEYNDIIKEGEELAKIADNI